MDIARTEDSDATRVDTGTAVREAAFSQLAGEESEGTWVV
jgi:hypothetical protein